MYKKKLTTLISILILSNACTDKSVTTNNPTPAPDSTPVARTQLQFNGIGTHGISDPSIAKNPSENRLWMSYSAVDPAPEWQGTFNYHAPNTRLAYSDDSGNSWTDSGETINSATSVDIGDGLVEPYDDDAGTWVHEVSRIIYDPNEDNWKLFWHHYLMINQLGDSTDYRKFEHGWIGLKVAATPEELDSATEIKLFGGNGYDVVNNTLNNPTSRSVLAGAPVRMLNTLDADLSACHTFSEPGVYATVSSLYMSLICYEPTNSNNNRVVLLKCDGSCEADNWSYIGTIFQNSDAVAMGYNKFSASEIFSSGNDNYLMISPVKDIPNYPIPNSYYGCLVFKFNDINSGTLEGTHTVTKTILDTSDKFNGACGYHESATETGFIHLEVFMDDADMFRIYYKKDTL